MQTPRLDDFLIRYRERIPALADYPKLREEAQELSEVIALYDGIYPMLENQMWHGDDFDNDLEFYQSLFLEQEELIAGTGRDDRYEFILSIPIADRPEHLQSCLESIYQLCLLYGYGGKGKDVYRKVRVIVAEDSQQQENIDEDLRIAQEFTKKGLRVDHVGLQEQYQLLLSIPLQQREHLSSILTDQPREKFYRKGQAANRNLSYLKMLQLTDNPDKTLYFLVDSDQLFRVNRQVGANDVEVPALNYFYYIDRIFRHSNTVMLTGKLVGDPPVSPSVMAANFIDDVTHFLHRLSDQSAEYACAFHDTSKVPTGEAAYHDMAKMFGFEQVDKNYNYRCPLAGKHDNLQCLYYFSTRLNAFFFGEHLTRKTLFSFNEKFTDLAPARTIYPGNYIVNFEGLKYIIPFGDLRLRMSGPTAGRLIQAEIGERFASTNLPMLHQRTQSQNLADDFRPGVKKSAQRIELSDEFERQFFGDLMLFSVAKLTPESADGKSFEVAEVSAMLDSMEQELLRLYQDKHNAVVEKSRTLKVLAENKSFWWNQSAESAEAVKNIEQFIENIDINFGENSLAWQQIQSANHRAQRKQQILQALLEYKNQRDAWDSLFSQNLV
jgi:hypothetical protein